MLPLTPGVHNYAFVIDGRSYLYFPPGPAIARMPILAVTDAYDGELSRVDGAVLERAAEPFPTLVRTLDAIHLATALVWRERMGVLPVIATHDHALGLTARTFGFDVRGI